jgi:hypothetical protein
MSGKPKKKKPKDAVDATVGLADHEWMVTYTTSENTAIVLRVSEEDAWNFDIERGLKVQITNDPEKEGFCKIHSKQGNKKYVTVDKIDDGYKA